MVGNCFVCTFQEYNTYRGASAGYFFFPTDVALFVAVRGCSGLIALPLRVL